MIRILGAFVMALVVAYLVSVAGASTHVVQQFQAMPGAPAVGMGDRLQWLIADVVGMAKVGLYPALLAIALAIAFSTATLIARFIPNWRFVGYILAGGVGLLVLHLAVTQAVGTHAVAASRTIAGLVWQVAAGALAGWIYGRIDRTANKRGLQDSDAHPNEVGQASNEVG